MFLLKYYSSLKRDIDDARAALREQMPDAVRSNLERELETLVALQERLFAHGGDFETKPPRRQRHRMTRRERARLRLQAMGVTAEDEKMFEETRRFSLLNPTRPVTRKQE